MSAGDHIGPSGSPEKTFWDEAEALGLAVTAQLEYFEALGVTGLPVELPPPAVKAGAVETAAPAPPRKRAEAPRPAPSRTVKPAPSGEPDAPSVWAPACPSLADLAARTGQCRACALAPAPPAEPVFGRGASEPLIVFVGPDPSIYEGGKADLLVTGIIEKGLKLEPHEYYITTLTRCPLAEDGNAAAEKKAIAACGPILNRELALLKPKVVLAMGSRPGQFLSGSADPVGLLRGRTFTIDGLEGTWLRVTFGLTHMNNSQEIKKEGWRDIQKIIPGLKKLKKV